MQKFNSVVYNKLVLQAEEAKDQGLTKLAEGISSTLTEDPEDSPSTYSDEQLHDDVYKSLWAAASSVIKYYNVESVDAGKINDVLEDIVSIVVANVKNSIDVDSDIGPLEPKLPGESK